MWPQLVLAVVLPVGASRLNLAPLLPRVTDPDLLLAMFVLGYSLPLGAVLLGVSLGKTALLTKNADTAIRWISGCILLIAGFYLLITL